MGAPLEPGWAAAADATAHVIVDALTDEVVVEGDDGHHLTRARRIREAETVTAADGAGQWRTYRVADVGRGTLTLTALGPARVEPRLAPALGVAFALTKGEKPETVIARLTELGVDRIVVFTSHRSVVRWDDARTTRALDRFRRVAREAAMQCRRSRLPDVAVCDGVESVAAHPGLVVADPTGKPADQVPVPPAEGWLLVVGPEGGLAEEELAVLGGAPRLAVGPHVLRAETATVAAAAALTGLRTGVRPGAAREGHGG